MPSPPEFHAGGPERHLLPRSEVPLHFPQFRHSAALAHLAHRGRGPLYVLIGGVAWYDPADIRAWLEQNKRRGPDRVPGRIPTKPSVHQVPDTVKRGRPTKLEQMRRRTGASAP